ncbi:unnamed protein product [Pylaiella littoralis]
MSESAVAAVAAAAAAAAVAAAAAGSTRESTPLAPCFEESSRAPAGPNAVRKPCAPLKNSRVSTPAQCFPTSRHRGKDKGVSGTRFYAIDAEMVEIIGSGDLPARRAMVSVGVVNERLETLLYSRVAVPEGCKVTDGAFARMEGGLWASWEEGIPAPCVSDFLERHTAAGGVLIGWEIHNDLDVLGFHKAASEVRSGGRESLSSERAPMDGREFSLKTPQSGSSSNSRSSSPPPPIAAGGQKGGGGKMRVVEVTDLFRTIKGLKCSLGEAYTCCFGRTEEGSHNAAVDARMTMELYNLWRRAGEPEQPLGLPLSFFVVNFHSFKPSRSRHATLWNVLRPDGIGGCRGALEKDSGSNTYKLSFRHERSREVYLEGLERRMSSAGLEWGAAREAVPGKRGAGDGYQLSCGTFKMHVLEHER